ncbi:MAG: BamA/TamA family outer membrane protein [Chitinophagaceae bacterium]|jgi:outer membrane protein assembly factor BamA|nr:BamA/TamA family outer membrane protein [Chitinophagaceae bacterium]
MRTWMILLLLFACWPFRLMAQGRYRVQYQPERSAADMGGLRLSAVFNSREDAQRYIEQLPARLVARGYLAASVDSARYDSTVASVWLYTGERYRWRHLRYDSTATAWMDRMPGRNLRMPDNAPLPPDSLQQLLLQYLASQGYPFAGLAWDSVHIENGWLDARMVLTTGPPYKLDSIVQTGTARFNRHFLYRYLQLRPGMPYNQQLLEQADQRLDELLFAERKKPSEMQMLGTGGVYNVFLDTRRSNVFNVLLGAMPASTQTPGEQLLITGDVNLLLRNALGAGETIAANWQQLQYKSPRINLLYQQPYLFSNRAGIDFQFDLFRKDTQFLNLQFRLGIPYQISLQQTGKVFYQLQRNNVAYVDTALVMQTRQLPDLADFTVSNLGVEWSLEATDYRYNPRRGTQAQVLSLGGLKTIRPNNTITNLKDPADPSYDYGNLYDTVQLRTYQLRIKGSLARYFPLGRQATVQTAVQGGWLQSANYYRNELFQIGGYKLLRGFDEESIYARGYLTGTLEYRYLTARNGYLFAFADGGLVQYKDQQQQFANRYVGAGLGIHFQTRNAVVNLSWAIGKRNDLPLDLRQSKIHLGFVNYF